MNSEYISHSEEDTRKYAQHLSSTLKKGLNIGLHGPIGSGKSLLTRYLLKSLGVEQSITSPTFTIINEYELTANCKKIIFNHLDLYRLNHLDEVYDLGLDEMLTSSDVLWIEWIDKFPFYFDKMDQLISIEVLSHNSRKIKISSSNH